GDNREGSLMNPLTTTMLGYYRPEYDSFTLSTLMNSYTTALYCCGNSILRDTLRVLHHPKTNGLAERFNKTLCESLAKLKEDKEWDRLIAPTLFAYRTKVQGSTKVEPFYLTYGRKPTLPMDKEEKKISLIERIQEIVERIPKIR